MFPPPSNLFISIISIEHGAEIPVCPAVPQTEDVEEKGETLGSGDVRTIQRVQLQPLRPLRYH